MIGEGRLLEVRTGLLMTPTAFRLNFMKEIKGIKPYQPRYGNAMTATETEHLAREERKT